jgi:hypothetical protein
VLLFDAAYSAHFRCTIGAAASLAKAPLSMAGINPTTDHWLVAVELLDA